MNIVKPIFISILFVPLFVFAQNQFVLPNAGLTPESPFYFLDKFGEALRTFFTFNPEGKAHLQITFAAERIAEIKVILETKGVRAPGLEVAESRLQAHLASVGGILDSEKTRGRDVSKLASDLDDEFEGPKAALEETFRAQKQALKNQEDELKVKIRDARRAGNTAEVEALVKQLAEVKAKKELLELKEEEQEEALEQEEEKIEREMEKKEDAEKAIREAEEEKQEVIDEAAEEGVSVPAEAFEKFDKLLAQAKELFAKENYVGAKQLAKQAEKSLEKVEDAIEELDETKEEEEELKEEQEEKGRESKEEEEEELKHDEENGASSKQASQVVTVEMRSGRFDDNVVDIQRGDTVRWVNRDSQSHWPASNPHPIHANLPGFDALRQLGPGESYEFTFTQSGTFGYHDHLNPSVVGQVIVR